MVLSHVHVTFHNPLWAVTIEREHVPRSQHRTKESACEAGRKLAIRTHADLIVHSYNGKIESHESFRSRFL